MFIQIAIGTGLLIISILIGAVSAWGIELAFLRSHRWLMREPHRPKLMIVVAGVALWVLGILTAGTWIWAGAFYALGIFATMEESVYFALVAFTTLGFGDILLPVEWRLLAGMAATNGLLNFGALTALLVEALRHVRLGQVEQRRRSGKP
jgi:hypothetical protein